MNCRLLSACVLLLPLATSRAFAADIPDYPFVFVVGKAEIDTPPDIARCSVTIRSREPDAGKASGIVEERLKSVLATFESHHIAAKDIESSSVAKDIVTEEYNSGEAAKIKGYDVSRSVKFVVRQLDSVAPIETSLLGSPNISGVDCQFDRADRAAVEAELLTQALHSAKDQADKLAGPLGRHVLDAVAISKVPFSEIPNALGFGDRAGAIEEKMNRMFKRSISADELLVPVTIHLAVSVNVLFKMD